MSKNPVIGVTEPSAFTSDCIDTIEKFFDGNPLKLCQNNVDNLKSWLDLCDGVILAGGVDIHPVVYGQSVLNDFGFSRFDFKRDKRELQIIHHCFVKNIPILGICRGHQLLGIYHGMSMVVDLAQSVVCHQPQRQQIQTSRDEPMHYIVLTEMAQDVQCKEMDVLQEILNMPNKRLFVNSFHHQGLLFDKKISNDVNVLGVAQGPPKEKIVELMSGKNWISCQWHPEYDWEENTPSRTVLEAFRGMIKVA